MTKSSASIRNWLLGATLATSAVVGGAAIAGAATTTHSAHKVAATAHHAAKSATATRAPLPPRGPRPAALTGADLAGATAAAEAAQPGATVMRAEQGRPGKSAFEVHMKKADGTPITVLLNSSFVVTGTEAGFGPPPGGHDGPPRGAGNPATMTHGPDETLLTGADLASATAAAEAAQPGATVLRAETNNNGHPFEVHMKKADGSYVTVLLNSSFVVTGAEAGFGQHPDGPGGQPPVGAPDFGTPPPTR